MKAKYSSYATEAYDTFSKTEKRLLRYGNADKTPEIRRYGATVPRLVKDLASSVNFKLPLNGILLDKREDSSFKRVMVEFLPLIQLPFPAITLEFEWFHGVSSKDAKPGNVRTKSGYVGMLITLTDRDDHISVTTHVKDDYEWLVFTADHLRLDKATFDFYLNDDPDCAVADRACLDGISWVITGFLCTLGCTNTEIVVDDGEEKPSSVKSQIRKSKGQLPFFSYKTLSIGGKRLREHFNFTTDRTHSSPRSHLRRGHIRRLKHKNVWVRSCVVGRKEKGVIDKDYAVMVTAHG